MAEDEGANGKQNLLCLARVSPLIKLSEYLNEGSVPLESHYPPLRHVDKYKMETVPVNYFFYGQCNYVLPVALGQRKSRAIGMLFDSKWVDSKGLDVIHFPFDSGACMDGRYVPHITDQELPTFEGKTNVSFAFEEKVVRFFGNKTSYCKGEHISDIGNTTETEAKLLAHYSAVPNDLVDMRGKTIEALLPEQIDFSHLRLLVLPEESIKRLGFDVSEIRNQWPGLVVETYNDVIDASPLTDTRAIQGAVFAFYDRKGYFS